MLKLLHSIPTLSLGAAVLFAALLGACGDEPRECKPLPTTCSAPGPSYATDVAPIIAARCTGCHKGEAGGPWSLMDYDHVNTWRAAILADLRDCSMPPPDSGITLPDAERELISAWLVCGGENN